MGIVTTMSIAVVHTSNWLHTFSEKGRDGERRITEAGATLTDRALREAYNAIGKGGPEKGAPDFYIFKGGDGETHLEDEGRTKVIRLPGVVEKCYAKIDDYGEPDQWAEMYEPEIVKDLKAGLRGSRYSLTIMLASDY